MELAGIMVQGRPSRSFTLLGNLLGVLDGRQPRSEKPAYLRRAQRRQRRYESAGCASVQEHGRREVDVVAGDFVRDRFAGGACVNWYVDSD
jgi:hypothetical protein